MCISYLVCRAVRRLGEIEKLRLFSATSKWSGRALFRRRTAELSIGQGIARLLARPEVRRETAGMPLVLVDIADRIATLTLNRPEARNALSSTLLAELRQSFQDLDARDDVEVMILTGADPAFSAGLDLKELGSADGGLGPTGERASQSDDPSNAQPVPRGPWARTTKPVIGAVNGVAVTGGFELVLQCDFVIASERARFGDTHTRVGIMPGWGLTALLPQYIGVRRAIEMSLTGNFMDAAEAFAFGLVNHVVPHEELLPFTRALAADIIGNNSLAVRTLLASYRQAASMSVGDGLVHEAGVSRDWATRNFSPDAVEARRQTIMERGRTMV